MEGADEEVKVGGDDDDCDIEDGEGSVPSDTFGLWLCLGLFTRVLSEDVISALLLCVDGVEKQEEGMDLPNAVLCWGISIRSLIVLIVVIVLAFLTWLRAATAAALLIFGVTFVN